MDDLISRQAAIDVLKWFTQTDTLGFTPRQIVEALPSAQPITCKYWDGESNYCALNRPSAQPDIARDIATILENEQDMRVIARNAQPETCAYWDRESNICALHRPSAQPAKCEDCGNFNKARLVIPQPERKTGKWVPKADQRYYCSRCDEVAPKGIRWNFCPNCGAEMEVEK